MNKSYFMNTSHFTRITFFCFVMKSECYLLIKEKKEYFVVRVHDGFKDSTYFFEFSLKAFSLYP